MWNSCSSSFGFSTCFALVLLCCLKGSNDAGRCGTSRNNECVLKNIVFHFQRLTVGFAGSFKVAADSNHSMEQNVVCQEETTKRQDTTRHRVFFRGWSISFKCSLFQMTQTAARCWHFCNETLRWQQAVCHALWARHCTKEKTLSQRYGTWGVPTHPPKVREINKGTCGGLSKSL